MQRSARILERPSGEQLARNVEELQSLVSGLEARIDDDIANDAYTKAQVDAKIASPGNIAPGNVMASGNVAGQPRMPNVPVSPHDLRATRPGARTGTVRRGSSDARPVASEDRRDSRDRTDGLLGFTAFPTAHWRQIWSTNPLERLNKEIKRCTDVVGTFPNPAALLRLAGHVLVEQHDEWDGADRRYFSEHSMKLLNAQPEEMAIPELTGEWLQPPDRHNVAKLHQAAGATNTRRSLRECGRSKC